MPCSERTPRGAAQRRGARAPTSEREPGTARGAATEADAERGAATGASDRRHLLVLPDALEAACDDPPRAEGASQRLLPRFSPRLQLRLLSFLRRPPATGVGDEASAVVEAGEERRRGLRRKLACPPPREGRRGPPRRWEAGKNGGSPSSLRVPASGRALRGRTTGSTKQDTGTGSSSGAGPSSRGSPVPAPSLGRESRRGPASLRSRAVPRASRTVEPRRPARRHAAWTPSPRIVRAPREVVPGDREGGLASTVARRT